MSALRHCRATRGVFSEFELAAEWAEQIRHDSTIFPFGWYQPPPNGISVLIGKPPRYERLEYDSLREPKNWPDASVATSPGAIIYPYLSAVDRRTGMIGDLVATFYCGAEPEVREWIREAYNATMRIAAFAEIGRRLDEVYAYADSLMKEMGGRNNTLSLTSGTGVGADIGHTIPGYGTAPLWAVPSRPSPDSLATLISRARQFVNPENTTVISNSSAFTIEPQMIVDGLPMASFHVIVAFSDNAKVVVEEFDELFDFFDMSWVRASSKNGG